MTKIKKVLGVMVLMAALLGLACPAFASTSVDIYDGAAFKDNLTTAELNALPSGTPTLNYSSYKHNNTFSTYTADGPYLWEALVTALNDPNIEDEADLLDAYTTIEFIDIVEGDDPYSSGVLNLADVLNGYYFESVTDTEGDEVKAIIATSVDPDPLRDFFGQQTAMDIVAPGFVKDLDQIVLGH